MQKWENLHKFTFYANVASVVILFSVRRVAPSIFSLLAADDFGSSSCFVINLKANLKKQKCAYATKETIYVLGVSVLCLFERAPLWLRCLTEVILCFLLLTISMNGPVIFLT